MKGGKVQEQTIVPRSKQYNMSEILIPKAVEKVDRNYNYKLDKAGNLIKVKYSIFSDPYTLVTLCVILMGLLYYYSILNNPLAVKNIDHTCENLVDICGKYLGLKDKWAEEHNNQTPNVRDLINTKIEISCPTSQSPFKLNLTP